MYYSLSLRFLFVDLFKGYVTNNRGHFERWHYVTNGGLEAIVE